MKALQNRLVRLQAARPNHLVALLCGVAAAVLATAAYFYMTAYSTPSNLPSPGAEPADFESLAPSGAAVDDLRSELR